MLYQMVLPSQQAMHTPDGLLSLPIVILMWVISAATLWYATRKVDFRSKKMPILAMVAAFVFAAQMFNFPIAGGTSGHLLGGALIAIVFGPWEAVIAMASVIAIQGLVFQDGGLLAMGANIFNMGIATSMVGYGGYLFLKRFLKSSHAALFISAWLSVVVAATFASIELWLSGAVPLGVVVPTMVGVHSLIGIGEGIISVAAYSVLVKGVVAIDADKDEIVPADKRWGWYGLAMIVFALAFAPFASTYPDGLEAFADKTGLSKLARPAPYHIFPDYTVVGLHGAVSTIAAGVIGVILVFGALFAVYYTHARLRQNGATTADTDNK